MPSNQRLEKLTSIRFQSDGEMSKQILKLLENVKPGDLIAVDWCDASTGKSSLNGGRRLSI
jgi:hypothetical protein